MTICSVWHIPAVAPRSPVRIYIPWFPWDWEAKEEGGESFRNWGKSRKQRNLAHLQLLAPSSGVSRHETAARITFLRFLTLNGSLTGLLPLSGGALGGFHRSLEAAWVEPGLKGCGHGRGWWWWGFSVGARTADVVSPGPESSGCRGATGSGRERWQLPGAGQWECQRSIRFVCTVSNFIAQNTNLCTLLSRVCGPFELCLSWKVAGLPTF